MRVDDGRDGKTWHTIALAVLMALFLARVAAQLIQWLVPTTLLPPFAAWHSATLPYPMLLASQAIILAAQAWVIRGTWRGMHAPHRGLGLVLLATGGLYFGFMLFRLVGGLTFLADVDWFQARIPTLFHLVLAGFLLVLAHHHLRGERRG